MTRDDLSEDLGDAFTLGTWYALMAFLAVNAVVFLYGWVSLTRTVWMWLTT